MSGDTNGDVSGVANGVVSGVAMVHRWDDVASDRPLPLIDRRKIGGEHAMLSHLVLHEGCTVPVHAHANEQFVLVMSGCLRFTLPGVNGGEVRIVDVRAGDVLHVPSNVPHGVTAIETTTVIDVFSPTSERTGVDG